MATKKSDLLYRNPKALKALKARLRAAGSFEPVNNKPEDVRAEVQRLKARIASNSATLPEAG